MKKSFPLFFLLLLVSCDPKTQNCDPPSLGNSNLGCSSPDDSQDPTTGDDEGTADTSTGTVTDDAVDSSVPDDSSDDTEGTPNLALSFETNVTLVNFSATQEVKIEEAQELIKKVVASDEFRTRVLDHTYNGQKTFVDNNGLTNEQIYQLILEGAEELSPTKNNAMDVEVELYYNYFTSTIGYTYEDSKRIWMNSKFFNSYTATEVADNLFHEWVHKLGFTHASSYSTSRDYSVPYALGYLVEELAAKY